MDTPIEIVPHPVSLSHGGGLGCDPSRLRNLGAALLRAAQDAPAKGVRYIRSDGSERFQPYPELLEESSRILTGLRAAGLKPGDRIIFQLHLNEDFAPAVWACLLGGFVAVPVSIPPGYDQPHSTLAKLQNSWAMLGRPVLLAGAALAPGLADFARRQALSGFTVLVIDELRSASAAGAWHVCQPEDTAFLLLTSGSTGMPKGVQLNHRNILWRCAATASMNGFDGTDVSLNWMPLDHVGGVVMFHLRDVFLACGQIHVPTEMILQNPLVWLDLMSRHRATNTWAPNFAYGLVNEQVELARSQTWDLSSLRFILNAGEAIVSKTARRFLALLAPHGLPATAMRPAWGMSETSSAVTYSDQFSIETTSDDTSFVNVGKPVPGISIRVVDRAGDLLPEGKIGSLHIKGETVTSGYFQNPSVNAESFTADGWFITGDLGVITGGSLTITGREKDVIIVNGVNFHSHEIESVVEGVEGVEVSFTAACPIRTPGENTDQVAVFFSTSLKESAAVRALIGRIRTAVGRDAGLNPDHIIPLPKELIPKTAIGKIQRRQLKERFEAGDFDAIRAGLQPKSSSGLPAWFYQRVWTKTDRLTAGALPDGDWIVFSDKLGLGCDVVKFLRSSGRVCIQIGQGQKFTRLSAQDYEMDLLSESDHGQLWQSLRDGNIRPRQTVHLLSYASRIDFACPSALDDSRAMSAQGLLQVIQGLARNIEDDAAHRLWVVSNRTFEVTAGEGADVGKSALAGLLKTVPHELPAVTCRLVDMDGEDAPADLACLTAELASPENHAEVAYRNSRRWRAGLSSVDISEGADAPPLRTGGCYILSGGLGGVGSATVRMLLTEFKARILIVGRSQEIAVADRLRTLRQDGGDVRYASADLGDLAALRAILTQVEADWRQPVDGVFHLAGLYETRLLADETAADFERSMRAKVAGAWNLHQLVKTRPGTLFVSFSSVLGHFGGYQHGAYATANAFLEGLSFHQRTAGLRSYNLLWSAWSGTGMNASLGLDDAARAMGFLPIPPAEGIKSLNWALRYDVPSLIIGLDGQNAAIRPLLNGSQAVVVSSAQPYVEPGSDVEMKLVKIWRDTMKLPRIGIRDNFFELGGRSLVAAKIFARIEKVFGKSLPLATFFKAPTIEQLALYLRSSESSRAGEGRMIALRESGSRPPLYFIPGGGHDVIMLRGMIPHLHPDQPFYGLQANGLDGTPNVVTPLETIEQVSKSFLEEIRQVQPKGPYQLGGHCLGCLFAYEMAQQLTAQGETVSVLLMIDPTAAHNLSISRWAAFKEKLAYHARKSFQRGLRAQITYLLHKAGDFQRNRIVARRLRPTHARAIGMLQKYTLRPWTGRAVLLLAEESVHEQNAANDPRMAWKSLVSTVEVATIPGDHATVLSEPQVKTLADVISTHLQSK